jgi:hypothetical protein
MRMTLVDLAGFNFVPGQPDFSLLANRMTSIGIPSLAAWLERHGHPTEGHDCVGPHAPTGFEANADLVLAGNPGLIGFSTTTAGFMDAVDLAVCTRARRPDLRISFGMQGETPVTVQTTTDFIRSLDLDEMNLTKFSPLYDAPIRNECASPLSGEFHEDLRLMNCLNFSCLPRGFASREEMDALYNEEVLRFYRSNPYRRRFARRLWQHRRSFWRLARNALRVMQAKRYFSTTREYFERHREAFSLHPRQSQRLTPLLGHKPPPLRTPVRVVPSARANQDQELPERP